LSHGGLIDNELKKYRSSVMNNLRRLIVCFLFAFASCCSIGQEGFTVEYEIDSSVSHHEIRNYSFMENISMCGYFIKITHPNGRVLEVFINENSGDKKIKKTVRHIINSESIDYSSLNFAPWGLPFIDGVNTPDSAYRCTNLNIPIINLFGFDFRPTLKEFKVKKYSVKYFHSEGEVNFLKLLVSTEELNQCMYKPMIDYYFVEKRKKLIQGHYFIFPESAETTEVFLARPPPTSQ